MDKKIETPLRGFVEAYATQNTEEGDKLIHEYICKKSQAMLMGESEDEGDDAEDEADKDDADKDDADKDDKSDKKDSKKDKKADKEDKE
jgi:hypothetical protein